MTKQPTSPIAVRPSSAFIPRGLHGQLIAQLGAQIVSGVIKPGALLQPEQIGAAYKTSRTVVREALRVLENKGLISARPNVGTRVRPIEQWNLLDADVVRWRGAAERCEDIDRDIFAFTAHLRAMRPALDGNLLYELLMENLTGVPRANPADQQVDTDETVVCETVDVDALVSEDTALEETDHGPTVVQLAEAAA